jgi:uncharacterized protein (DUF1684 family)
MAEVEYIKGVLEWRSEMDAAIRRENNWSTLAGLFWLKQGANTLGSSPDCGIRLPPHAPRLLGAIELEGTSATLKVDAGQSVEVNGAAARTSAVLRTDQEPPSSSIRCQDLGMAIVRRGSRVGLRVWDKRQTRELPPRTWYEVDEKFKVPAVYTGYPVPVKVGLPNLLGETETGYVQGYLSFKIGGKPYRLDATELEDGRLYLQFGDVTNGVSTYPSGRYLFTDAVQEDGRVVVDFNKAYNPPCALNEFEPCNFAASGNHLKAAVEAGELYTAGYITAVQEWRSTLDSGGRHGGDGSALVGLFWLNEGLNILGSSPDCDIRLPKEAPRLLGAIRLKDGAATLELDIGQSVEVDGVSTRSETRLRSDQEIPASIIACHDLTMGIIRRGSRTGLRLWSKHEAGDPPVRTWFDVDEKYRVPAVYTPYPVPVKVNLPNVLGETEIGYVQGYLSFKLGGKSCSLDAAEQNDRRLYLQFCDLTNATTTYPSGRYLYTEPVQEDGAVLLDFNKSYNPPCALNELELCNFAPSANHLKVAIEAGERYKGKP